MRQVMSMPAWRWWGCTFISLARVREEPYAQAVDIIFDFAARCGKRPASSCRSSRPAAALR